MSQDAERIKKLVAFKRKIETRVTDLDSELKELQATLDVVNSILLEKGFKRVEITEKPSEAVTMPEQGEAGAVEPELVPAHMEAESESANPLKSVSGEILADVYVDDGTLHVVPARDKNFDVNTPPFNQFFLQRILLKMQERDNELARGGQLVPEKILCFEIVREGDIIREIVIRNFDSDRLRELKSSIRWTFEKMLEKMRS